MVIILQSAGCIGGIPNESQDNLPVSEFIIGKWRSERENSDIYGTYHEEFFIKFINNEKLLFCNKKPNNSFCAYFEYEEIDEGIFTVENERINGGEWEIVKDGDDLKICIWNDSNCMTFSRDTSKFNFALEVLGKMK